VAIYTGNVSVVSDCQRVLRLNHLNVVCNSRSESISGLFQVLGGQRYRAFLDRNFLRRRFQIEISVANLLIDPGPQIFQPLSFP
jgi:hypothetical protein